MKYKHTRKGETVFPVIGDGLGVPAPMSKYVDVSQAEYKYIVCNTVSMKLLRKEEKSNSPI